MKCGRDPCWHVCEYAQTETDRIQIAIPNSQGSFHFSENQWFDPIHEVQGRVQ